jgi:hypothetical protein
LVFGCAKIEDDECRRAIMTTILVTAEVDENHRVTLKLLDNVPAGKVLLRLEVIPNADDFEPNSREWVAAKLKAAGLLAEEDDLEPEDPELAAYKVMSDEEEESFGRTLVGPRPMEDYVYEDREERFD